VAAVFLLAPGLPIPGPPGRCARRAPVHNNLHRQERVKPEKVSWAFDKTLSVPIASPSLLGEKTVFFLIFFGSLTCQPLAHHHADRPTLVECTPYPAHSDHPLRAPSQLEIPEPPAHRPRTNTSSLPNFEQDCGESDIETTKRTFCSGAPPTRRQDWLPGNDLKGGRRASRVTESQSHSQSQRKSEPIP